MEFTEIENEIDWSNFDEGSNCANEAIPFLSNLIHTENVETSTNLHVPGVKENILLQQRGCSVQFWPFQKKICKTLQDIVSEVD